MHFKPVLFALSTLAVLVVANELDARQIVLSCKPNETLECCDFHNLNDGDAQEALKAAGIASAGLDGMVGTNCGAPAADATCADGKDLGCCTTVQSKVATGCIKH